MTTLLKITINGHETEVPKGTTILQAAKGLGVEIPHFCYHPRLSVAGNCRMCLVEVEGAPKPVASCAWPVADGMVVNTQSKLTMEAQKGTMEFLLINHPLDCPICDQAGECTLQDISLGYGSDTTRFHEAKRAVEDKNLGAKIKTVMTRCIHCTRCVRFATEIAGVEEFGATSRGEHTQIGTYVEHALQSELAGNMIDLCPVGALTNKPYAFAARPWELKHSNSIDVMHSEGAHIRIDSRFGKILRVLPRECDDINEEWIADTTRFSADAFHLNRLESPLVNGRPVGWQQALAQVALMVKGSKKDKIGGIAAGIHAAEDLLAFYMFMSETLGSAHVDSRPAGSALVADVRAHYVCNTPIAAMEQADAVLLVGCNPRLEAPLINLRLRKAVLKGGAKAAMVGTISEQTYPVAHVGNSGAALTALLEGAHPFAKVLQNAKRPLLLVGEKAVMRRDDALAIQKLLGQLVETFNLVNDDWHGFNLLHQQVGTIAGLDMRCLPAEGGMPTAAMLQAAATGALDMLVLYGEDDIRPETLAKLQKVKKIVYIGSHNGPYAQLAHVVLPVTLFSEKAATWPNAEGRLQQVEPAVPAPLHAKEDWKVFRALSGEIGKPLPFNSLHDVRAIMKQQRRDYALDGADKKRPWKALPGKGRPTAEAFVQPVTQFYLNNAFLRASATMAQCQQESGAAKAALLQPVAAVPETPGTTPASHPQAK